MSQSSRYDFILSGQYTKAKGMGLAAFDLATHPVLSGLSSILTDGVLDGQADLVYMSGTAADPSFPRTISISGTDDIDLNNPLPDLLGDPLPLIQVKVLLVKANDANAHDIQMGGASANAFSALFGAASHKLVIKPGGIVILCAPHTGYLVTPSFNDILRFTNMGSVSTVSYHVAFIGTSA
jgi:hypothetical protein